MRIAIGCLIALAVAYTSVGESEEQAAPCPKAAACAKACEKASACDKTQASETAAACPTAQACKAAKNCEQAKTCETKACETKTGATVAACAKSKDCANASACAKACAKSQECEAAKACAVAANVLNANAVSTSACNNETACNKKPACCKQAAVATACAEKKACAQATSTACAEKCACPLTASCPEAIAAGAEPECAASNCCKEQSCPATAEATDQIGAPCAKLAVASDAECLDEAAVEVSDCCTTGSPAVACHANVFCGTTQLAHLARAAEHLTAAGLDDEAASVRAMSVKLCQELVAQKNAQIASLQAEIAALEHGCQADCRSIARSCDEFEAPAKGQVTAAPSLPVFKAGKKKVTIQVKAVELSLGKMKRLGFEMQSLVPAGRENGSDGGATFSMAQPAGIHSFLDALEREHLAKVLTAPRMILAEGQHATITCGDLQLPPATEECSAARRLELGTHINLTAKMIGDKHVRVDFRPYVIQLKPLPEHCADAPKFGLIVHECQAGFEMELGKTAVVAGPIQESGTHKQDQVQVLFLVTPELIETGSLVKPVNHEEPSEAKSKKSVPPRAARIRFSHSLSVDPSKPPLPRIHFTAPAEANR